MFAIKEQLLNSLFIFTWDGVPIGDTALRCKLVAAIDFLGEKDNYKDSGLLNILI